MYITENQSLGESVLFILSARNSLSEMVEDSGHKSNNKMINFLMNEASDYEIMSLLVEGALPDEKYNEDGEFYLFSKLKEQVLANAETISEMVGSKTFSDFMTKVDTVYPNYSTAVPMLEFFSRQDASIAGAIMLAEQGAKQFYQTLAKKGEEAGGTWKDMAKTGPLKKVVAKSGQTGQKGGQSSGQVDSPEMPFSQTPMPTEPSQVMRHTKDVGTDLKAGIESAASVVAKFAKTPAGLAVGGAALATLLAYGAAKTYKRFFSKAAGACRGMSGSAKTDCMGKFRGRALMAQASDLQRGMASCGKSKNPAACKSAVGGKIERLKAKARKHAG